jgi:hypothetical protein
MCGGLYSIKQSVPVFKILTAFIYSNKNCDGMQRGIFYRWVGKDAPHVMKYKVM